MILVPQFHLKIWKPSDRNTTAAIHIKSGRDLYPRLPQPGDVCGFSLAPHHAQSVVNGDEYDGKGGVLYGTSMI